MLASLHDRIRSLEAPVRRADPPVSFGAAALDTSLGGGLARAALHEIYAASVADASTIVGFATALALRAADARRILWVRQEVLDAETGHLHPPGLAALGADPARIVLVRARGVRDVLWAGAEAARCGALGALLIEACGEARQIDMTVSRRLSLAAGVSGVFTLLLRAGAKPVPSAAFTRWLVRAAPSRPLAAEAPGYPAYDLTLLRHRGGAARRDWRVEWNHDERCFRESPARWDAPLPRSLVPLPAGRAAAPDGALRRAG
jgi:protein ImuA